MSCSPIKVCRWSDPEGIRSKRIRKQSWCLFGIQGFGQTRNCCLVFLCRETWNKTWICYWCCREQILWNPQSHTFLLQEGVRSSVLFPQHPEMPAVRLQGSRWPWRSDCPQVLAAGLPCRTAPASVASGWLRELMKSVVVFAHWQKEGRFTC